MTYPNAYAGIKKIRIAEILEVVALALLLISGAFAVVTNNIEGGGNEAAFAGFGLATVLAALPAVILPLIAYILRIMGLGAAAKDNAQFKTAYIITFVALVISLLSNFLPSDGVLSDDLFTLISSIADMLVFYYVCYGIKEIATALGRDDIARFANTVAIVYLIGQPASAAINFFTGDVNVSGIISIVSSVLALVAVFMYISLLSKALDALENA